MKYVPADKLEIFSSFVVTDDVVFKHNVISMLLVIASEGLSTPSTCKISYAALGETLKAIHACVIC